MFRTFALLAIIVVILHTECNASTSEDTFERLVKILQDEVEEQNEQENDVQDTFEKMVEMLKFEAKEEKVQENDFQGINERLDSGTVNSAWEQFEESQRQNLEDDLQKEQASEESDSDCIKTIEVYASTGNLDYSGFSSKGHKLQYTLKNGKTIQATLPSPAARNKYYKHSLSFSYKFNYPSCVKPTDIASAKLVAGGNDGWYLQWFQTTAVTNDNKKIIVSNNGYPMNRWLDGNDHNKYGYNADKIDLVIVLPMTEDTPNCGYGVPTCECNIKAKTCILNLEIDEIMTFTSYKKVAVGLSEGLAIRGVQGVVYNIDEATGEEGPHPFYSSRTCADRVTNKDECTEPQYVDGINYRMAVGVNGQIPGPTIVVHEGQQVIINVHNNMSSEGVSIHWHGMHQNMSPWMDGVGQVTQCQIGPSSSYSYDYIAKPAGSFWYHSHSGAQRTDGFFGALIVKESPAVMKQVMAKLSIQGIKTFNDLPDLHSITLIDWSHEASLETFSQLNAGLGFYEDTPSGEVPDDCSMRYDSTRSIERAEVGPVPFNSGLINGKGRHYSVPYSKTRLSTFPVQSGQKYRFRLIGAQGLYAYKFSIDGHRLTIVATDGYWTSPKKDVDYIIIHTGERYDFILDADQPVKNYWMRAETLEINPKGGPPYKSLDHVAEGILQYVSDVSNAPVIKSTEYEEIKLSSPPIQCTSGRKCNAVNCPFKNFHPLYYTECTNIQDFRLLLKTPLNEIPNTSPCSEPNCQHFINFNFEGDSETSSVNGRNFILPPAPPQTQYDDYKDQANQCDLSASCNPITTACSCTQMLSIPFDRTVQIVLTALGAYDNAHPIHLHGHTFHVVKVGYPDYDQGTGFIAQKNGPVCDGKQTTSSVHNRDISCADSCPGGNVCPSNGCNPNRCTKPGWKNNQAPSMPTVDEYTIRKDTVMVPAGGYVVINFKSDNPGMWFLHCHIEVHQLEGMAVIINEAFEQQQKLVMPKNLNKCGDFSTNIGSYKRMIATSRSNLMAAARAQHSYSE